MIYIIVCTMLIYILFGALTLIKVWNNNDNETLVLWACATVSAIVWPVFWVALFVCAGIEYVEEHMT